METPSSSWNPYETLGVQIPESHHQCIGRTKKGRSCRRAISVASRSLAVEMFSQLAILSSNGEEVKQRLPSIASLLLCRRNHQNQSGRIVQEWEVRLYHAAAITETVTNPPLSQHHHPWQVVTTEDLVQHRFSPSNRKLALIQVSRHDDAHPRGILVRKYRQSRSLPDGECGICRERLDTETEYVDCGNCSAELHWSCFYTWAESLRHYGLVKCVHCSDGEDFDVFRRVTDETTNSYSNGHDSLMHPDSQSAVGEDIDRLPSTPSDEAVHIAVAETDEMDAQPVLTPSHAVHAPQEPRPGSLSLLHTRSGRSIRAPNRYRP